MKKSQVIIHHRPDRCVISDQVYNPQNWRSLERLCVVYTNGAGGGGSQVGQERQCNELSGFVALSEIPLMLPAVAVSPESLPPSCFVLLGLCPSRSDMTAPAGSWQTRRRRTEVARVCLRG